MSSSIFRSARAGAALLLACALALLTALTLAAPAGATAEDPPPVRWATTPADASGPDGRRVVEHTLDPGETVHDHLAVQNVSEEEVTFELDAADGFYTRTGRFDMLAAGEESVGAGTWITLPESVTVAAGETEVVEFALTVPPSAEPGDHAAGITASVLTVQSAEDGTSVGVDSRVGFRVTTRVTGELTPAASVANVEGSYSGSWNAFRPGRVSVSLDVLNEGNTRLFVDGTVEVGGEALDLVADDSRQEILPEDTRTLTVPVDSVWPSFLVPVEVTVVPEMVAMDGSTATLEPIVVQTLVWAVPWPQLVILTGLVLLALALLRGRRRSRERIERMLAEARAEGRREASDDQPTPPASTQRAALAERPPARPEQGTGQ